jgi:hypothetical protein
VATPSIVQFANGAEEAVDFAGCFFDEDTTVGNTLLAFMFGGGGSGPEPFIAPDGWSQVGEQYSVVGFDPYFIQAACFASVITESHVAGYYFSIYNEQYQDQFNISLFEIADAGYIDEFQYQVLTYGSPTYVFPTPGPFTPLAPESLPFSGMAWIPNNAQIIEAPAGYTPTTDTPVVINLQNVLTYYGPPTPDLTPIGPFDFEVNYPSFGLTFLALVPPSPNVNRLNAHLRIDPAQLVLIPPDATLPFNQTLLYKVRKQYGTGFSSIPRGVFVSTAGTMDPPGVTSSGQAVLTPYEDTIGPFTVTFYEVP